MSTRLNTLTQDELQKFLRYDPESGHFTWIMCPAMGTSISSRAGSMDEKMYIRIQVQGKRYRAHRLAFLYMTGEIPKLVDHKDRIPFHNMRSNLRSTTYSKNRLNSYSSDRVRAHNGG